MPEGVTVATLAIELREQGKTLKALIKQSRKHFDDCGSLQALTAAKLQELSAGQTEITKRFVLFDRIANSVLKYGRRGIGIVIGSALTAWATLFVAGYMQHVEVMKSASVAVTTAKVAADTAVDTKKVLVRKIDDLKADGAP
jgi:hypothetical protein